MRVVIALGGNAFNKPGEPLSQDTHLKNIEIAAGVIATIAKEGHQVVVTHGNGPQVGYLAELQREGGVFKLDALTAATQGILGYFLTLSIDKYLGWGMSAAVVTRVEVDCRFSEPTKPIGVVYGEEEVKKLAAAYGWRFRQDPRGGWRRVVPSPRPLKIIDVKVIKDLLESGYVVVAGGGGGIPLCNGVGVEGVVDKDLTSALLAVEIQADVFLILTDVDGVYLDYGRPTQRKLTRATVNELLRYLEEGQFPPGSMGPKVEAVVYYIQNTNGRAAIGALEEGYQVFTGAAGTQILRD